MPTLEDRINQLYLRTGQVITEDFFANLVDVLKDMAKRGAVTYEGYVTRDLRPITDLEIDLGEPELRFNNIYAGYGVFTYDVFVADRKVLKDGDPIYISDIYPEAKAKITQAIDDSYVRDIYSKLIEVEELIASRGKPKLLAYVINYSAPELADIFAEDVLVNEDGRVRVKLVMEQGGLAYLKHYFAVAGAEVIALLNAGVEIPANTWQEFDVVATKNDRVNIRVTPSQKVTVLLYNIDEV